MIVLAQIPACFFNSSALSVCSHGRSTSVRPKATEIENYADCIFARCLLFQRQNGAAHSAYRRISCRTSSIKNPSGESSRGGCGYFSRPLDLTLRAGQENPVALLRERLDASGDWENPAYPRKRGGRLQVAGGGEVAAGFFRWEASGKDERKRRAYKQFCCL